MTIRYKCSECGASLKIKDDLAGTSGKCPQCKTAFTVPGPEPAASQAVNEAGGEGDGEPNEDDIFGKDFFKLQDVPAAPKRHTLPAFDDDDDDPKPVKAGRSAEKPADKESQSQASSADNAAVVASSLLAKTGKKNRPDQIEDESAGEEVDYSELKYLLTHRILPIGGGTIVAVAILYWLMSSMMGGKHSLPELAEVTGQVTLDGQPAANAQIQFIPEASTPQQAGAPSLAVTGPDGKYEAMYQDGVPGAIPGKHLVRIRVQGRRFDQSAEIATGSNEKSFTLTSQ